MSKPLFKNEDDAIATIKKSFQSIEIIDRTYVFSDDIASPTIVHAVSRS